MAIIVVLKETITRTYLLFRSFKICSSASATAFLDSACFVISFSIANLMSVYSEASIIDFRKESLKCNE